MSPDRTVAFIQEWLPRYRLPFFNLLRDVLGTRANRAPPLPRAAGFARHWRKRSDAAGLPWAYQVVNSHLGPSYGSPCGGKPGEPTW